MTDYYSYLGLSYNNRTKYKNSILERDNHICQLCGGKATVVDHIVPWVVSHDSAKSNLRALCRKCNLATRRERKDAAPVYDAFIAEIELEAHNKGLRPVMRYQLV